MSATSFNIKVDSEGLKWDEDLRQQLISFKDRHNWSFPQISRDMQRHYGRSSGEDGRRSNTGMSSSTISNYANMNWASSQESLEKLEQRLRTWLDHREREGKDSGIDEEIASAKLIQHGLAQASSSKKFVTIIGPSGMGKSLLARHFANNRTRGGMVIVESYDGMTPRAFLGAICRALGEPDTGSLDHLINRVSASLVEMPRLVAVDEANFLTYPSINHLIYIYNQAKMGVILVGTSELEQVMTEPKLARVRSRLKLAINLDLMSEDEIRHRLEDSFDKKDVTRRVVELARMGSFGGFRELDTLIESASDYLDSAPGKSLEAAFEKVASRQYGKRETRRGRY